MRDIKFEYGFANHAPIKLNLREIENLIMFDHDDLGGIKYRREYTGLKDNNWVEIYEGDIVSDHNGIGIVKYAEKYAAFRVSYGDGRAKWFYDYLEREYKSIEVIGNKFENPDLLTTHNTGE